MHTYLYSQLFWKIYNNNKCYNNKCKQSNLWELIRDLFLKKLFSRVKYVVA